MTVQKLPQSMRVPELGNVRIGSRFEDVVPGEGGKPNGQPQTHAVQGTDARGGAQTYSVQDANADGFVDQTSRANATGGTYLQDTNFDGRADTLQRSRFAGERPLSLRVSADTNHDGIVDQLTVGRAGRASDTFDSAPSFAASPAARVGGSVDELLGNAKVVNQAEQDDLRFLAWDVTGDGHADISETQTLEPGTQDVSGRHFGFNDAAGQPVEGSASDTNVDGQIDLVVRTDDGVQRMAVDANHDTKIDALSSVDANGNVTQRNDHDFDGRIDWVSSTTKVG